MKKVLVMCTGNSCRSIIAEALINAYIDGVEAKSCGTNPTGSVNQNAKKILEQNGIWDSRYYSKHLNKVLHERFDLVVTVCDSAKENCPVFPYKVPTLHVGFEDPDGKEFAAFEATYEAIRTRLLPQVRRLLTKSV